MSVELRLGRVAKYAVIFIRYYLLTKIRFEQTNKERQTDKNGHTSRPVKPHLKSALVKIKVKITLEQITKANGIADV
jgi:hypothetical protein